MALPENRGDREFQKFSESVSVANKTAVAVVNPDGTNIAGGGGAGGDGAILDGVTVGIRATVLDTPGATPAGTDNPQLVSLAGSALPAGNNNVGDVDVATLPPLPAGANTIGGVTIASLPLPTGAATEATLDARSGALTETPPATDTASSGLNGRLQRIAQRLTSLVALLPAALVGGRLDVNLGAAPATVTVDSELPAAAALADNASNPTAPAVGAFAMGFDGSTWDRVRADGGSLWEQGDVAHDGVDANNPIKIGGKASTTVPTAISASGDRVNAFFDPHGRLHVRDGKQSVVPTQHVHVPAANTKATISKSAAGAGIRIVCTKLTVTFVAGATAPAAVQVRVDLIDGASGGTTYLDQFNLSLPATAGATNGVVETDVWYVGTANTALTLEFSAAGGANTLESVAMSAITVTE